jgi:hypothetical protein
MRKTTISSDTTLTQFKARVLKKYPEATFDLKKGILRIKGIKEETTVKSWKDLAKGTYYAWAGWDKNKDVCFVL